MSDNKLSETFAKYLLGKSIVSGLKQEPEKTYGEIKCLKCKHWQKVPLITEYNPDGTRKHPAFCDECGNNLEAQEKERKQKRELRKKDSSAEWRWIFKFWIILTISMITLGFLYFVFGDYRVVQYLFTFLGFIWAVNAHILFSFWQFCSLDFYGMKFVSNPYEIVGIYESVEFLTLWLAWTPIFLYYTSSLYIFFYAREDYKHGIRYFFEVFFGWLGICIAPFILYYSLNIAKSINDFFGNF